MRPSDYASQKKSRKKCKEYKKALIYTKTYVIMLTRDKQFLARTMRMGQRPKGGNKHEQV